MRNAIKGVLLDVGGVLVDLDGMPSLAALLNSAESGEALHDRWMASKAVIAHEIRDRLRLAWIQVGPGVVLA